MTRLDRLIAEFEAVSARPWSDSLAGPQRVWMVVYDENDERRLRLRLSEFENAAQASGHTMMWCDLTDAFPKWMGSQEYRDAYFEYPQDLLAERGPIGNFRAYAADMIREKLDGSSSSEIVVLTGAGSLFGLIRVSQLIEAVHGDIVGRLAVFFPGTRNGNMYRLLDARDGWNYLALPVGG